MPIALPSLPTTLRATVFLVSVVATAIITWFANDALNAARLRVEVLDLELATSENGDYSAFSVWSIDEFIPGSSEYTADYYLQFGSLGPGGLAAAVESGSLSATQILTFQELLERRETVPLKDIKTGIEKAKAALLEIPRAVLELRTFLAGHQEPSLSDRSAYIALFDRFEADEVLTTYVGFRPSDDSSPEAWLQTLREALQGLQEGQERIEESLEVLESDHMRAQQQASERGSLTLRVLLVNDGNVPSGFLPVGMLGAASGATSARVVGRAEQQIEELIVPPKQYTVASFRFQRAEPRNSGEWERLEDLFESPAATCVLTLQAMNGKVVLSGERAFYKRSGYIDELFGELIRTG